MNRATIYWIVALFCFCGVWTTGRAQSDLALELCRDGEWEAAWIEARRVGYGEPDSAEGRFALYLASLHLGREIDEADVDPDTLLDAVPEGVRGWGAYALGQYYAEAGEVSLACRFLKRAFVEGGDPETVSRSAEALYALVRSVPSDCVVLDGDLVVSGRKKGEEGARAEGGASVRIRPFQWVIGFYQHQIGPALGYRCSMEPSCSKYAMEAARLHGWLAVPLTADRLIRETDHVAHRIRPIEVDGMEKYDDPVSAHTGWWSGR